MAQYIWLLHVMGALASPPIDELIRSGRELLHRAEEEHHQAKGAPVIAQAGYASLEMAAEKFRLALRFSRGSSAARGYLLQCLTSMGDAAGSYEVMDEGIMLGHWQRGDVKPEVELALGKALYRTGDPNRIAASLKHLRTAVKLSPMSHVAMDAHFTMGMTFEKKAKAKGLPEAAWRSTKAARTAIAAYNKAILVHDRHGVETGPLWQSHWNLALMHVQSNELVPAERHLRATLELDPKHVAARMHLINVLRWQQYEENASQLAAEGIELGIWSRPDQFASKLYPGVLNAQPWPVLSEYEGVQAAITYLESSFDDILSEVAPLIARPVESGLATGVSEDFMAHQAARNRSGVGWHGLVVHGRPDLPTIGGVIEKVIELAGGVMLAQLLRLEPGTVIRPHCGEGNFRWVIHLGLDLPGDVVLRVAGQQRAYYEKKAYVFDDSFIHTVEHHGVKDRFILLIHIPNPEYSAMLERKEANSRTDL